MINESHFEHFPSLESKRLQFRSFVIDDAKEILGIRSNTEVMRYMDSRPHESIADAEKFISNNIQQYKNGNGIFWAIIEKASGHFIGDFSYWRIDRKNARAEIGYTLKPAYWGKGYMKESMQTLLPFGFKQLQLHSIEANINPNNIKSCSILTRMGFQKEAYFRENYYYNGTFLDSEIYSLLESDLKG